jgi:hypothetical protein
MTRPLPVLSPVAPRLAQASAVALGSFFCVATSQNPPPNGDEGEGDWGDEWTDTDTATTDVDYEDIEADVYLHNASDHDIRVRTRPLLQDVQLDCIAVDEDPGLLLSEALFGEGQTVTLPPSTNVGVHDLTETRECVRRARRGRHRPRPVRAVLAVRRHPDRVHRRRHRRPRAAHRRRRAARRRRRPASHRPGVAEPDRVRHRRDPAGRRRAPRPRRGAPRLERPPFGERRLADVDVGPDGCVAVTVDGSDARWYLCVPQGAFPFAVDQWVRIDDNFGAIDIRRIPDPQSPVAVPLTQLVLSRGDLLPTIKDVVLAAKTDYDATLAPEPPAAPSPAPTRSAPASPTARSSTS